MNKPIFKDIEGYENRYQISNNGEVLSLVRNKILKPQISKDGYVLIRLEKDYIKKTFSVHRLVAKAFLDNPNNLPQVNHINEDKTDNRVENLEWCDKEYNLNYGTTQKRRAEKISRSVYSIDSNGIKETFVSAYDATRKLGIDPTSICKCCRGQRKTAGKRMWFYV